MPKTKQKTKKQYSPKLMINYIIQISLECIGFSINIYSVSKYYLFYKSTFSD